MNSIKYDFNSLGMEKRLPSKYEVALYRIAQELINNVLKHSEASELEILLSYRNNLITFRVEDNGVGILDKSKGGIGLQSIKSRLDLLNGIVKFEGEHHKGLVAIVQIPFDGTH